ncbi:MAG TPA: transcription elongation factor GreB [Polyangia bacterium]
MAGSDSGAPKGDATGNDEELLEEFLDEEEDLDEDGKPKKRRGPNYITPAGYRRLVDELDFLHTKKRPEVVGALADAAAEGDRSENAEYIYRKRQLREIDRRMRFLSKRLDIVQVVDPREQKRRDKVFFGATVTVADEDGVEKTFRIVGVDEVQGDKGDISWRSPIGEALLGKDQGDTILVKWHAAGRVMTRELTILTVAYD